MEEPKRIGLTLEADAYLEELLEHFNPPKGENGVRLIKFDWYRLAVALGIKKGDIPPPLNDKRVPNLKVFELDPEGVFRIALESSGIVPKEMSIYEVIERMAEHGIREFYNAYQETGEIPLEEYLR